MIKRLGWILGPLVFSLILYFTPQMGFSVLSSKVAAVCALMACWWVTEALPMGAVSLLPLALFPWMGIMDISKVSKCYAEPNIFLFMGGFMMAMAMQKWGLHQRFALLVIDTVGTSNKRLLAGFMIATAFISMWVSNTATTMMILPVALAVLDRKDKAESDSKTRERFAVALMLSVAYASGIGGVATLIGTPPNIIFSGQAKALLPAEVEVTFVRWFLFAFPLAVGFLVIAWAYLAFFVSKSSSSKLDPKMIRDERKSLGKMSFPEYVVGGVFILTAAAWIFKADFSVGNFHFTGWVHALGLKEVSDATIAMTGALILFAFPADLKKGTFVLDWVWASKLPWEALMLFGGGFALAEGFATSGLSDNISSMFAGMKGMPVYSIVWAITSGTIFSSEVMSNSAQVTLMMPVLASLATQLNLHPYLLMIPMALGASYAFMMPAGTPPNAIVFGSGRIKIFQMVQVGLVLNILASLWITLITCTLMRSVLGV